MDSTLPTVMRELGYAARLATLRRNGVTPAHIAHALASGYLIRPIRGWFATARADADQLRAITAGGRIGCVSALRRLGVWSGEGDSLHLHVPPSASRLDLAPTRGAVSPIREASSPEPHPSIRHTRAHEMEPIRAAAPGPPVTHWRTQHWPEPELDWIVSVKDALTQAILCQPFEHAVAVVDSSLALDVISKSEWDEIRRMLPRRLAQMDRCLDARAGSGNESIVRLRLHSEGLRAEPQWYFPGIGHVDLFVEGAVVVEMDSEAFHSRPAARRRDRSRTLLAQLYSIPTLRLGPENLADDEWPIALMALRQLLLDSQRLSLNRMN